MKPSEMFEKAEKELQWGKHNYYADGCHCLMGAVLHYALGHKACLAAQRHLDGFLNWETMNEEEARAYRVSEEARKEYVDPLEEKLTELRLTPVDEHGEHLIAYLGDLNDNYDWDFRKAAEMARKAGF